MATMTVPVNVTPEAKSRIAELGMQREFEEMLEYSQAQIPDVRTFEVYLDHGSQDVPDPCVVIVGVLPQGTAMPEPSFDWRIGDWKIRTFPPEVCVNFVILTGNASQ